jgi:dsRNA-specific ribonuclease
MAPIQFDLTRAEQITRYQFQDKGLLSEALQSATKDRDEHTDEIHESDGNRRLAKLGVVVLELAVVDEWFRRGMSHRASGSNLVFLLRSYTDED